MWNLNPHSTAFDPFPRRRVDGGRLPGEAEDTMVASITPPRTWVTPFSLALRISRSIHLLVSDTIVWRNGAQTNLLRAQTDLISRSLGRKRISLGPKRISVGRKQISLGRNGAQTNLLRAANGSP